jgi:hypothetical protein
MRVHALTLLVLLSSVSPAGAESVDRSLWEAPHGLWLRLGVDWGLTYWTEHGPFGVHSGIGSAMNAGYDGALRATLELRRWVALDVRVLVAYARAKADVAGPVGLLTVGSLVAARFTLPFRLARPYLLAGPGVYSSSVHGSGPTPLYGSTAAGIAVGFGIEVPLPGRISVGAEYVFHFLIGERFSDDTNIGGGDPVTANVYAQVALW